MRLAFATLIGLIGLALRRMANQPGLNLLALLGIVLAVALVTSAGFFAQATDLVMLRRELALLSSETGRPPFATRVYVLPSRRRPLPLAQADQLGHYVAESFATEVGLPVRQLGLHVESGSVQLRSRPGDTRYANRALLGSVNLVYVADIQPHMQTVAGAPFDEAGSDVALDVWPHTRLAEKMGLQIGDTLAVVVAANYEPLPVRVVGFWQARDRKDPFWFNDPDVALKDMLLVRRQDYVSRVEPLVPSGSGFVAWHLVLDEDAVVPERAADYAAGFKRAMTTVAELLPDAKLDRSPLNSLETFTQRKASLTALLLAFNLPALGFLLAFLIITATMITHWQRRELAVMSSRGVGTAALLAIALVEELLLIAIGCPLGVGLGMLIARLMGYTVSFLSFTLRPPQPVSLQGANGSLVLIVLGVALVARLLPLARAARQSIVAQTRDSARPTGGPLWYRSYLDLLLILPTYYVYRQLAGRGTLVRSQPEQIFSDPLLILLPALFILTAALLCMRLWSWLMRALGALAGLLPILTPYLALRQLDRQSRSYISPLLLLIISLALGVYTYSMAASLDQWLEDRLFYQVGADLTFKPSIESDAETVGAEWVPPPDEFADLPGVLAATRVGDYPTEIALPQGKPIQARFVALDRREFPQVAWFRGDLADESLGGLMNELAPLPEGVLVSQQFLDDHQLRVGDSLELRVGLDTGIRVVSSFVIAGAYHGFPTAYEDQVTLVGNLDYLFSFFGFTFPHNIWLRLQPGADRKALREALTAKQIEPLLWRDTQALITQEQASNERVGIFGTLSVGFLAAAAMALISLLLHSHASLQERRRRFAVLRALGLQRQQLLGLVALEYCLLSAYGAAAGTLAGTLAAYLFTPFFRATGERGTPLPTLVPVIAQEAIVPLVAVFAGAMLLAELAVVATTLYRDRVAPLLRVE